MGPGHNLNPFIKPWSPDKQISVLQNWVKNWDFIKKQIRNRKKHGFFFFLILNLFNLRLLSFNSLIILRLKKFQTSLLIERIDYFSKYEILSRKNLNIEKSFKREHLYVYFFS